MDDRWQVDPEIEADLELRERTERQRAGGEHDLRSPVIGVVPCRGHCGAVVDWTAEAEHTFDVFNRELASRGEPPLDKTRIVFCNTCRKHGAGMSADRNRKACDKTSELIRELRGGTASPEAPGPAPVPERERDIVKQLEKLGHPDIVGLQSTIRHARDRGGRKGERKSGV